MTVKEAQEKIELYRQGLAMIFCKEIADKTVIKYFSNGYGTKFWVNRAFTTEKGIMVSPTGFKSFNPIEFDAEIQKLFEQAKETDLAMRGELK